MTAAEMIRGGFNAWTHNFSSSLVAGLFLAGIAVAAVSRHFRNGRTARCPDRENQTPGDANSIPFPVWSPAESGGFSGNPAFLRYREHFASAARGTKICIDIDGRTQWFSVCVSAESDPPVYFAIPADDLVAVTNRLDQVMDTLSTTFAHLPVGLAVFGGNKKLDIFNPSLARLLGLDPAWLATRPSLSALLERLRNAGHLPEKRNFLAWRKLLEKMEAAGPERGYSDVWNLTGNKVLRVTGRPHSGGAVAFLFEDISDEITVKRQNTSLLAVHRALLDHISDAVTILDASGNPTYANAALDKLARTLTPADATEPGFYTLLEGLAESGSTFRACVRAFICGAAPRKSWSAYLPPPVHRVAHVSALPDGSTCIALSKPAATQETSGLATLLDLAGAVFSTFEESSDMLQPLNLDGLSEFLGRRNITLNLSGFSDHSIGLADPVASRRILWYLVLAASNICHSGGEISLISDNSIRSVRIACLIREKDIVSGSGDHLSFSLLRQLVGQAGGGVDWVFDETARPMTVSCVLPVRETPTRRQTIAGSA